MKEQIKQKAKDIMKADYTTILIASVIWSLVNEFASYINDIYSVSIVSGIITTTATACFAQFYFRAFNRGKGQLKDIFSPFTDKANLPKFLIILVFMCLIDTGVAKLTLLLDVIPIAGLAFSMVLVFFVTLCCVLYGFFSLQTLSAL